MARFEINDMQTVNDNQNSSFDSPGWCLLEEFSFREFLSHYDRRGEPRAGVLFRAEQEFGMSPEMVEKIEKTLVELAKEAMGNFQQGAPENLGRIRIFCQKKRVDHAGAALAAPGPYQKVSPIECTLMKFNYGKKLNGGWGYFVVERRGDVSPNFSENARKYIDLYLYQEGE